MYPLIAVAFAWASLPSIEIQPTGPHYDINARPEFRIELTTLWNQPVSEMAEIPPLVAEKLREALGDCSETYLQKGALTFQDAQGDEWKVQIDGHTQGRPVVEVTPADFKSKDIETIDLTMDVLNRLDATPQANIGGGHLRIKIKKSQMKPRQFANILRLFYSYNDIINFRFRHPQRSHRGSAPSLAERSLIEKFLPTLQRLSTRDTGYYSDLAEAKTPDRNMELLGGFLRQWNVFDHWLDLNLVRLYDSYADASKDSLHFEFRLFNAPADKAEARLHIKFLKALFNQAMNSEDPMPYEHHAIGSNAGERKENLRAFLVSLGLDPAEF